MSPLRHRFAAAIALLLLGACATTQEGPKRELPPSPTFLWKVSADDRPGTVYVLGTVHLREAGNATLDSAVLEAVDDAHRLVLEVVPDAANEQAVAQLTQELGFLPEGESLLAQLDEETQAKLKESAEKVGLPAAAIERMRPWLASLSLTFMRMQLKNYSMEEGVEKLVLARFQLQGERPTESLETPEEQLRLFAGLTPEQQLEMLRGSLDEVAEQSARVEDIQRAYHAGDVEGLAALLFAERGQSAEADALNRALFDDRNERMVERMLPFFDVAERTVVAVGAGHVVGERGIPALLLAKGFRVEAVPALGLAPVRPAGSPPPGVFRDEELGFSAAFGVAPEVQRQEMSTPDGHRAGFTAVTANVQLMELSVVVNQFPGPIAVDLARVESLFDAMLERLAAELGSLESSERLTLQGHPAARFAAKSPTHRFEGLIVLRGARMYTVLASRGGETSAELEAARQERIRRFVESFQLLDEGPADGQEARAEEAPLGL